MKKRAIIIAVCAIVIVAAAGTGIYFALRNQPVNTQALETVNPSYQNADETVSVTGTMKYNEDYTITSTATGEVIECTIEEGNAVTKGQVLYRIKSDALQRQIEQTKISLEKAQQVRAQSAKALDDLSVKSYATGMVTKVYVHNGDMVQAGVKIADVVDQENLVLKVPFNTTDVQNLYIGQPTEVTLSSTGGVFWGNVGNIYASSQAIDGGKAGTVVEINVVNPGAVKAGDTAYAKVGSVASVAAGAFENKTSQSITAAAAGQVENLSLSEGNMVYKNQRVLTLKNDALRNNVTNADLQIKEINNTLSQLNAQLEDYVVKSPVDGIVTSKMVKLADNNTAMAPMAVISDTSHLYAEAQVDELNAAKIQLGQTAKVSTQDASSQVYTGTVEKIADVGTPQNGITYYTVKILMDTNDGLLESMNVNVDILTGQHQNVLTIPTDAVRAGKVKVVTDKGVIEKKVETGIRNKDITEIVSGLSIGDKVVTGGNADE